MKKYVLFLLSFAILFSLVACGGEKQDAPKTLGEAMRQVFRENSDMTAEEIADAALSREEIEFMGSTAPVTEGELAGFKSEISGFDRAVMFAPNIGTIPFIGYVFEVSQNAESFAETLKANADPRWNICTEAEETVVETENGKVFFVMGPKTLSEL